jgi:MFS family permease
MTSAHVGSPSSSPGSARQSPASLREAWIALAGLSAVFLFEMLDNSILNVALPTIARELHATVSELQWVTGVYSVVFGGLMLLFGSLADRIGRRRMMLIGLVLLAMSSLGTAFVTTSGELIAVRAAMGVAAAMTTPGSIALAFRLFRDDGLRVRGMTLISTVGLVGLSVGPTVGGLALAFAPWQALLLANVPVAMLAFLGIRLGIPADDPAELHRIPIDVLGAALGTVTILVALIAPTLFVEQGIASWAPWTAAVVALLGAVLFVLRERSARFPLLDLTLVTRPLVSSGLLYKAATGIAVAGLGYLVTLQLQLDYGWPPALAAIGLLPQVVVLLAAGPFVNRFVQRVGFVRAAWLSAVAVVAGLAVYGLLGRFGYPWIAVALVLVAAGIRVNGLIAGTNVLRGLPADRTSIGSALVDTAQEVATGVGIAVSGTILAARFAGELTAGHWSAAQAATFEGAVTLAGVVLTVVAALLVAWGILRARRAAPEPLSPAGTVRRRPRPAGTP